MKRLDLSVGHRLFIGFAAAAVLLASVAAFTLVLLGQVEERNTRLLQMVAPRAVLAEQLERAILERAVAVRTYALTGEPAAFREADAHAEAVLTEVLALPADGPGPGHFVGLGERAAAYRQMLGTFTVKIAEDAPEAELRRLEQSLDASREQLVAPVQRARAAFTAERRAARIEIGRSLGATQRTLLSAAVTILAVLLVTSALTIRSVRSPTTRLAAAARALTAGDFEGSIALTGPPSGAPPVRDELAQLSHDFAHMARALADATAELQRKNEEIQAQNEEIQAQNEEIQAQNEELQAQNEELQVQGEELRVQGDELRGSEAALREADARKDEFLAMLSHELRNPLAPIRNGLTILDQAPAGTDQARRARAVVDRQVTHLTRLVDDLLDVTRITAGKIRLQRAPLDLTQVLRQVAEDCSVLFKESDVDFSTSLPARPVLVDGDAVRLAQVVGNLLQNAAKFTPKGRVTLALEADPKRQQAIVHVTDTGLGIDAATRARLFQPFAQGEHTLARSRGGLGLGLALVKGLVELHDGQVTVRSDGEGQGTDFRVELPLARTAARSEPAPPSSERNARRILIIEDNADAADSLRDLLTLRGHQVEVAYDGALGLERARTERPEVVLCDVGLPGKDGYAVARALRGDPSGKDIILIAITGYALEEDRQKVLEAGFHAHLAKPIALRALEQLLASLVRGATS
jgi:signal transduction histidine kinase/ActR/RegA family two-component response regulator